MIRCLVTAALVGMTLASAWNDGLPGTGEQDLQSLRRQAQKERTNGNYKDAFALFEKLIMTSDNPGKEAGEDLEAAVSCLERLGRTEEADALIERGLAVHGASWRFLWKAADLYMGLPHTGTLIGGEFHRGGYEGKGTYARCLERDRVRALRLFVRAMKGAEEAFPVPYVTKFTACATAC